MRFPKFWIGQGRWICYICKAFDKVPHGKLLYKLKQLGLPLSVVRWVNSYLKNRKQFVVINNCASDMLPVSSGVPQGSVLSPLLFLIYVNDLAEVVSDVSIKLFADDCVVFKEIPSKEDHDVLQYNLLAINDWCDRWVMLLNNEKTVLLRVTRKMHPSNFSYTLQNNVITEVRKYKYLGVTLSSKLNWSDHVSDVCISSLRKLWYLRRKLKDAPANTKLMAQNACVRAKLEYASVVWGPFTIKDISQLEKVQRKAVRFIYGKYRRHDSPSLLMKENNIQTLDDRRRVSRLIFLHDCLSGKIKIPLPGSVKPWCN